MNFSLRSLASLRVRLIFFTASLFSIQTYAQLSTSNFTQFTEKDGLPGVQVNRVLIDSLGYVWTGTLNGLARYDGYAFKRFYFNPNDTNTLHGLEIWAMFEDRKRQIWISSTTSFLDVYNPIDQKFRQYKFTDLLPRSGATGINIRDICEDDNGRMYFGLDSYDGDSISTALLYKNENEEKVNIFPVPADMHMLNIYRIKKDNSGTIWIFSWTGIFKIDKQGKLSRFQLIDKEFNGINDYGGDMIFDKQGHMWIISLQLKLFDIDLETATYKTWYSKDLYRTNDFYWLPRKIVFDKDENIWIGTNGGLQFFDRETGQFSMFTTGTQKELEHTVIDDLSFDSFGTLWIGTTAAGLVKYDEKTLLKSYSYGNGDKTSLTFGWANNIYEASDSKIWITTGGSARTSGINILDPHTGDIRKITYPQIQKRISGITSIWENTPGEYYLGGWNGLYTFSEKTLKLNTVKLAGLPEKSIINYHLKDSKGNEWLCTTNGVYKKDNGADSYNHYDLSLLNGNNSTSNLTTRMVESKKHGLWILTDNGLFLYNYTTGKIERHGYDKNAGDIFVTQDINSLYEDADGIVWVGTWSGGFSKYNVETKKIKTYTRNEGLPSMSIQGILADEKNNTLWLSTFEGLSRFNLKTEQFNNFSIADGIQGQLFADGSQLKTSGGLFAFGGSNGITIFNPDDVNKNSIPPKVFLTDLKLFNKSIIPAEDAILKKPVYETEKIILSYNQNNLSIEYIALHFSNPALNKYSYKLENYDNEWRDVGNQRVAFYPNLPPGEYTFHVKAANDKGVWNEKGATLLIVVEQPWWKTTWAYIIYGLLFIVFGFAVNRYLRRRLVQKERERSRAKEMAQAKEIEKAYNELKVTQSQLIQSEKMASLGELTAGIAHEIQNPLNFVNNFSEVNTELIDELNKEANKGNLNEVQAIAKDIRDNEEKILHHGKRADAIVKGMLQHSRSSTGVKEPTDINALADEYLRLSYHGMRAKDKTFNSEVKTDFDETIGKINIVPQDIGRVLLNLYNNAFYAVNEKAKQKPNGYEPTITVSSKKINNKVELTVMDNGNGIPQKVVDKIFQPFFTTKPTGEGTGLGLSLSYDIIKAHGGEIKVETKEGEGAEFCNSIASQYNTMKKIILITTILLFLKGISTAQINNRDSLKQELASTKEDTAKVNLLCLIGWTYAFVYPDTAIIYANKGLELSRKTGYISGEATCLNVLSLSLTILGNFTSGLHYGFDYLAIGEKLHDTSIIINAYDDLGICYREQEDYNEALKYEYKAEALLRITRIKSIRGFLSVDTGLVWSTMSSIYERSNRLDSALYYGHKAYQLIKNWSGLYLKLGNIYAKLGQTDTALYYYRKGIPLAEQSLIYIDLVDIYNKMSEVFESAGNKDSSVYYANKSIVQQGVLTYPEGRLRAATQLANLYESQGLKDSAIKYLKLSVALREKMFDREKTRESQSLAFNEKIHQQELATRHQQEKNKIKTYALLVIILVFLIIAFIQWHNNKQKQNAKTKIEKAYSELKTTQAQLIQSEKMASLGELTAGIAHEIQNPLNFVNNFSEVNNELIEEMNNENDINEIKAIANDIKQNNEKINHHGKRADAIVKGMLQHSRSSTGVKEPTDINALAGEYLRLSYHGMRAKDKSFNATMNTDFDESIGKINIVPQDIGRVLLNLYNNAFYAVNEKAKQKPNDYEPTITVSSKKRNNKVELTVMDNGNGIPQKVVDKIFQPFFTTKPTGEGTGLGLSLSYDIIKAHGGDIKVNTVEGEFTEFVIQLPVST